MNVRIVVLSAVLSTAALLSACGADRSASAPNAQQKAEQTGGVISGAMQKALTQAKKEIAEGNINIDNGKHGKRVELSPKGDFIIDGKPVPVTPEQRALLVEYRGHVVGVATAGLNIGMQGADLAQQAVTESIKSVFTGGSGDDIDQKVEAQSSKVEAAALQMCDALPGMMESQDRLAAALPEFKPYANLTQSDIDECRDDAQEKGHKVTAAAAEAAKAAEAPSKQ